jgi:hypothetical protein
MAAASVPGLECDQRVKVRREGLGLLGIVDLVRRSICGNSSVASPVSLAGVACLEVRTQNALKVGPQTCIDLDKQGVRRRVRLRENSVGVGSDQAAFLRSPP